MRNSLVVVKFFLLCFIGDVLSADFRVIEQSGKKAAEITQTLNRIKLPDGFKIGLYAIVPNARHIAVGLTQPVVFVGTRKSEVWSVTDKDNDFIADDVRNFAPKLKKDLPNGPCFNPQGDLFIAEQNRVTKFTDAQSTYLDSDPPYEQVVDQGKLIPRSEQSRFHNARVCRIGPDGQLYISLGQPYNVSPPEKHKLYHETGIGGIIRMQQDGRQREVFAYGARNSVGMDFHPQTQELWWTDNQVDWMGDDIPPGEINRQTQPGQHFGFPWFGGGQIRTDEYKHDTPPKDIVHPAVETIAHAADLGMVFYTGNQFPEEYQNGIFSAQHGSWNRSTPVGARVMFTSVDSNGNAKIQPFAYGWIDEDEDYLGRPVDVAQLNDGSLLVSDDLADAIYRIWYDPEN